MLGVGLKELKEVSFENISRDKLKEIIINNAGKVTSSVSSKSQTIAGNLPGPSKMAKADKLGLKPLNIEEFISLYKIEI